MVPGPQQSSESGQNSGRYFNMGSHLFSHQWFWVVLKHKSRQAGVVFLLSGGMSPAGRRTVLYEKALFAFLDPRHEAFSQL